jgi:hypothetical protein
MPRWKSHGVGHLWMPHYHLTGPRYGLRNTRTANLGRMRENHWGQRAEGKEEKTRSSKFAAAYLHWLQPWIAGPPQEFQSCSRSSIWMNCRCWWKMAFVLQGFLSAQTCESRLVSSLAQFCKESSALGHFFIFVIFRMFGNVDSLCNMLQHAACSLKFESLVN